MIRAIIEWIHHRMWQRKQARWMLTRGYCAVPPRPTPQEQCGCKDVPYLIHVTPTLHYRK